MELVKFHVGNLGARPIRHRHPVTGRDVGIGCVEVDLAGAPRRQNGRAREDRLHLAGALVQHVGAHALIRAAVFAEGDQIDAHVPLEHPDVGALADRLEQCPLDFAAGDVAGVHDPPFAVAAFAGEIELAPVCS